MQDIYVTFIVLFEPLVEAAGGKCLPCVVDIRDEVQIQQAVEKAVSTFGGIDILVNNASAIFLAGTTDTPMKRQAIKYIFFVCWKQMYVSKIGQGKNQSNSLCT